MPSILSDSNSSGINPGTLHPDPDPTPDPAPDPDPDPDPAPERSTVALSGVSALKTPLTQRSSPQTPPNARSEERRVGEAAEGRGAGEPANNNDGHGRRDRGDAQCG